MANTHTRADRHDAPRRTRSRDVATSPTGAGVGTVAQWPLDVIDRYPSASRTTDPWVRLVREMIELYRTGQADQARQMWSDDVVWRVGDDRARWGEFEGGEAILGYHTRLARLADGEFRQRLLAVEGSGGPVVTAYLWTRAKRGETELEMPTLVVFELSRMHVKRVTELPGDPAAWNRFWAD
ncbi:MAG TPA: nuclear transport factor 2 family protein [Candidatus Limnocylindrales bacterium]|nr:nuclear transport factor 2 family protein [Candidatus Limnocylindrales bacterium]